MFKNIIYIIEVLYIHIYKFAMNSPISNFNDWDDF